MGAEQRTGLHVLHWHQRGPRPRAGECWGWSWRNNHSSLGVSRRAVSKDAGAGCAACACRYRLVRAGKTGGRPQSMGKLLCWRGLLLPGGGKAAPLPSALGSAGRAQDGLCRCWTRTQHPRAALRVSTCRAATESIPGRPRPQRVASPCLLLPHSTAWPGHPAGTPEGRPQTPGTARQKQGLGPGGSGRAERRTRLPSTDRRVGGGGPCPATGTGTRVGMLAVPGPPGRQHGRPRLLQTVCCQSI